MQTSFTTVAEFHPSVRRQVCPVATGVWLPAGTLGALIGLVLLTTASGAAAQTKPGATFRVLQMALCNGGSEPCYAGGSALAKAESVIVQTAPNVVTLNGICESDLLELRLSMGSNSPYAFEAAGRYGGGDYRCVNNDRYGMGIIARNEEFIWQTSADRYPLSLQKLAVPPESSELRAYLCARFSKFYACVTEPVSADASYALPQCQYLTATALPAFKDRIGLNLPTILAGDLGLDAANTSACVPSGYTRVDDGDVQHVIYSNDFALQSVQTMDPFDAAGCGCNVTDHRFLLATLTYAGGAALPQGRISNDLFADGRLSGSFVQPALFDGWSDSSVNAELSMMKSLHMGQLVIQWTANTHDHQASGRKTTIYPTALSGYTQSTRTDVVGRTLTAADAAGVAVYLGLQVNDDWWTKYASDSTWLDAEASAAVAIGQELWTKYGAHPSLKGWYLALESENAHFGDLTAQTNLINFYRTTTRALHGLGAGLPVAIAPFYNAFSCTLPGWQCADAWGNSWSQILHDVELDNPPTPPGNPKPGIDIIALQDGIGAGHAAIADLPAWFGAVQHAIVTAGAHTVLFADTETYSYGLAGYIPVTSRDIVSSINAVQGKTNGYWAFSFNHYQSPRSSFGTSVYYNGYNAWAASANGNGTDGSDPTTPGSLRLSVVNPQSITLNWTLSTDTGSGMAGYTVFRNGELIAIKLGGVASFSDSQLEGGQAYNYQVQAFDGSGSLSALSNMASVTTPVFPAAPTNYARCGKPAGQAGCVYTSTIAADPAYPDLGGNSLTDGQHGSATAGPAWQGRGSVGTYSFTIDLGTSKTIREINSTWLQVRNDFVFLPPTVVYYVGTKSNSMKKVATVTQPPLGMSNQTKTLRAINLSSSGRYVKIEVTSSTAWTMLDEVEIKGQ